VREDDDSYTEGDNRDVWSSEKGTNINPKIFDGRIMIYKRRSRRMNVQTLTSPKRMMKMYKSTKKTEKNKENYEIYITTRMIKTYKGSDIHEVVSKIRYEGWRK
jgi:hypothetical protein